jgi:hypothetical protein
LRDRTEGFNESDARLTVFSGVACTTTDATESYGNDRLMAIVGETWKNFWGQNSLEKSTA